MVSSVKWLTWVKIKTQFAVMGKMATWFLKGQIDQHEKRKADPCICEELSASLATLVVYF